MSLADADGDQLGGAGAAIELTSAAEFVEIVVGILAAFELRLDIRCCCRIALDQALLN